MDTPILPPKGQETETSDVADGADTSEANGAATDTPDDTFCYDAEDIQAMLPACDLKGLGGAQPHSSWSGWAEFLANLKLCSKADGVLLFVMDDRGFLVFPNGIVYSASLRQATAYMDNVRKTGALNTLRCIKTMRMRITAALLKLN